jgi:hypothetical protein
MPEEPSLSELTPAQLSELTIARSPLSRTISEDVCPDKTTYVVMTSAPQEAAMRWSEISQMTVGFDGLL